MFINYGANITPTRLIAAYRLMRSHVGVVNHQESRSCWGILLKAEGRTWYDQAGKQTLSDRLHVILLPKGARYSWKCEEQGECIVIDFDAMEQRDTILAFEISDSSYVRSAFTKIERCLSIDNPVSRLEAMQQLYGLLVFLSKSANKKYTPKEKHHLLAPAVEHMIAQYQDPTISNDELASLCGISTVHFRKTFESVYGIPPIRYLHDLRIAKAKAILSGDYTSITQVSESVGYRSVYHFSKMFRIYTGMSPSEYAKTAH